jgi:hypothetical protein
MDGDSEDLNTVMITRSNLFAGDILSRLLHSAAGRLRCFLLAPIVLSLVFLTGCGKSGDQSAAQASPSNSTSQSALSPAHTESTYTLGTVIRFGTGGGSERFKQSGWSGTEKDATWTTGNSATLSFPIAAVNEALNLRISLASLSGMTNPTKPSQPVEVVANGQKIAEWAVTARSDFNAVIPASVVKNGGALVIELKTPKAVSPKAMGISEDARVLGVYCFELAITKGG